jgi:hypothetical protein
MSPTLVEIFLIFFWVRVLSSLFKNREYSERAVTGASFRSISTLARSTSKIGHSSARRRRTRRDEARTVEKEKWTRN